MRLQGMSEQKKLMFEVFAATMLPLLVFLAGVLIFLHLEHGHFYLLIALSLSFVLLLLFTDRYQLLGTMLSFIIGIYAAIVLILLYGTVHDHRTLTMSGWVFSAVSLLSVPAGYPVLQRTGRRTASRYPAVEQNKAFRIIFAGNITSGLGALLIMASLVVLSQVLP
jgi:hypothetical protein